MKQKLCLLACVLNLFNLAIFAAQAVSKGSPPDFAAFIAAGLLGFAVYMCLREENPGINAVSGCVFGLFVVAAITMAFGNEPLIDYVSKGIAAAVLITFLAAIMTLFCRSVKARVITASVFVCGCSIPSVLLAWRAPEEMFPGAVFWTVCALAWIIGVFGSEGKKLTQIVQACGATVSASIALALLWARL